MAVALNHLGKIALRQCGYEEAQSLYQRSFAIYDEINDRGGLATACNGLANSAVGLGHFQTARQRYQQALQIAADIDFLPLILTILADIGRFLIQLGQVNKGGELLQIVINHSASGQETQQEAQQTIEEFEIEPMLDMVDTSFHRESVGYLNQIVEGALLGLNSLGLGE